MAGLLPSCAPAISTPASPPNAACWNRRSSQQQQLEQLQQQPQQREQELRQLHGTLSGAQERLQQLDYWRAESEQLSRELRNQLEVNSAQEAELREVTIRLEETRFAAEEKQRLLTNSEQRLSAQFENLANRIFENSGKRVDEQNRQSLNSLIGRCANSWTASAAVNDSFGRKRVNATRWRTRFASCSSSTHRWRRKRSTSPKR